MTLWDGTPMPPGLKERLKREYALDPYNRIPPSLFRGGLKVQQSVAASLGAPSPPVHRSQAGGHRLSRPGGRRHPAPTSPDRSANS